MAISSKPTSGESEGRTATKAFRKRGFSCLTTKPRHNSRNGTCPQSGCSGFRNRSTAR
jgi:hypothetical protein